MLRITGHKFPVYSLAFSPDSRTLASGSRKEVKLWEAGTNTEKATLKGHREGVACLAFSPDGRFLASAGWDGGVCLWDVISSKKMHRWRTGEWGKGPGASIAFSPDSKTLASGYYPAPEWEGPQRDVLVWDLSTYKQLQVWSSEGEKRFCSVSSLAWSPDGRMLALSSFSGIYLLGVKPTLQKRWSQKKQYADSLAWAPDGTSLAVAVARTIELWDVVAGTRLKVLTGHKARVSSIAFSPGGETLLSASFDGIVCAWDLKTGQKKVAWKWSVGKPCCVAVSPNGMLAACGGTGRAFVVWDLA